MGGVSVRGKERRTVRRTHAGIEHLEALRVGGEESSARGQPRPMDVRPPDPASNPSRNAHPLVGHGSVRRSPAVARASLPPAVVCCPGKRRPPCWRHDHSFPAGTNLALPSSVLRSIPFSGSPCRSGRRPMSSCRLTSLSPIQVSLVRDVGRLGLLELALSLRDAVPGPGNRGRGRSKSAFAGRSPSSAQLCLRGKPADPGAGPARTVHPALPFRAADPCPRKTRSVRPGPCRSQQTPGGTARVPFHSHPPRGDAPARDDPCPDPPQAGNPLLGVLPFDAAALERGIDLFLQQLERWSLGSPPPGGLSLLHWGRRSRPLSPWRSAAGR